MTEKKRIAFLCHPYHRGGVTRWMADAATTAANNGIEVYFVTVDPVRPFLSSGGRDKMCDLLTGVKNGVKLISKRVNFTFEFGTENYRANIYSDLVQEKVPEGIPLIVSDDPSVWNAAGSIAGKYPMIGVLHGDQDVYYDLAKKYLHQLSICVCVSNRIKNTMAQRNPHMEMGKLFIIPCGIKLPQFAASPGTDGIIHMVFIGRLTDYEKRAADLVLICASLHRQGIAFHLDIAGNSDSSQADFTQRFTAVGVGQFVSFHGWRSKEEVQELLNKSDVLLLTSNSEGMPLVMMEALASGCGFVGTRVSGIEDYENKPAASECMGVYAVGDIEDAVNKIKKVAAVPAHTRQVAARKLADAEFSIETCLDKYFAAIATIKKSTATTGKIKFSFFDRLMSDGLALARYMKMRLRPK